MKLLGYPVHFRFSPFVFGLTTILPSSFQVETVEMANLVREVAINDEFFLFFR